MGGSGGHSKSDSSSDFATYIDGRQAPYLQQMWDRGLNLFDNMNYGPMQNQFSQVGDRMAGDMSMVYPGLQNQLGGGFSNPALERSLASSMADPSQMGRMYESILGGPGNTYADPLKQNLMQNTWDNLERGGIKQSDTSFANLGRAGSDRNAVENALLKRDAIQDANQAMTAIDYDTFDKDLNWKMNIARQADLGRGQAQDRAMDLLGMQNQSQMGGLNYMPGLQGLQMGTMSPYMSAYNMPMDMMSMLGGWIGAPVMAGHGSGNASSFGMQGGGGLYG